MVMDRETAEALLASLGREGVLGDALRSVVALHDNVTELTYRLDVQHEVTAMVADDAIARAVAEAGGDVPW